MNYLYKQDLTKYLRYENAFKAIKRQFEKKQLQDADQFLNQLLDSVQRSQGSFTCI